MSRQGEGGIAWTDETWNPVRGCRRLSPGCLNCYAEGVAVRFSGPGLPYEGLARRTESGEPRWTGVFREVEGHLLDPLRWTRDRMIFVNSMSDVFGEGVSDEYIDKIFAVALACHVFQGAQRRRGSFRPGRHIFQFLTKRASRQRAYFAARSPVEHLKAWAAAGDGLFRMDNADLHFSEYVAGHAMHVPGDGLPWSAPELLFPLPDVWLGVSIENGDYLDRADDLAKTPAAVRWVSQEPQIGVIDWTGRLRTADTPGLSFAPGDTEYAAGERLVDWIVIGGESGTGARPFDVAWARSTVAQCKAAGVACFVKQMGAYVRTTNDDNLTGSRENDPPGWGLSPDDVEENLGGFRDDYQGAPVRLHLRNKKGGDPAEWPEDLRVREFPQTP